MGDTLLPEIGVIISLYIMTRMLEIVLAKDVKAVNGTVYSFATVTTIAAGIACSVMLYRGFLGPLFSRP
jgi:hypothetical protein